MMTKRELILDALVPYFKDHSLLSSNGKGGCYYRYTDNDGKVRKCAVGKYIPDEHYNPGMEETEGAVDLLEYNGQRILREDVKDVLSNLEWSCMQNVHDQLCILVDGDITNYHVDPKFMVEHAIKQIDLEIDALEKTLLAGENLDVLRVLLDNTIKTLRDGQHQRNC